ncbi:GNAT family N-acetyltransferase [Paractinoplanes atraurantiacus]|uniref:Acetyltransferase (GNAT) domain-containing protein n=1 Tax=Paractinoplanes atraurantiacus TaxID=1036182 RepID=A0A285J9G8_9ACTN|nr:GNAT family N-acetyltransferase [Actinoplanes atraurantiacus]SNY56527.1 Acetyltransferase (GNAT) domain-containing protein [Actinoplanes atraurantiacus]
MAEAAVLKPDDRAWADTLSRVRHDVYHRPEYARLDAGSSIAFRYAEAGRVLLLPLLLRPVPDTDLHDAVSPYGYPGPVSNASSEGFFERAWQAFKDLLCTRGVVTAFVRLHPLLPVPTRPLAGAGTLVRHGETVSIDLTLTAEQMWSQTHRSHRNQINKARRAGVTVVFDDWSRYDEWIDTYHATMRRVGATSFYFFSRPYFQTLQSTLEDKVHLAVALSPSGEVLGGNLFFSYGGIMHTHLQATRDGDVRHADKLLYDEVRAWGRAAGATVYHLGGGVGGAADSLFRYKAAFSPGRQDFHTWRVITDPRAYDKLAGTPTPEALEGRFPPYR